jgi:hypothetical protein
VRRRVPHSRFLRVGLGVSNAERIEALLWQRTSSLLDVQLLPAAATSRDHPCQKRFRPRVVESPKRNGIPIDRLCGDAGTRTSSDE